VSKLLRGGRLNSSRKDVVKFTSSLKSDRRLWNSVVKINLAHTIMLMEQKILNWSQGVDLLRALNEIGERKPKLQGSIEDIHMYLEEEVVKKLGLETGGNLHVGKSRNDQVSTAIRMELRESLIDLMSSLIRLQEALIELASKHLETVFPGYTHLQPAQPVTFAHYLLAHVDALERCLHRLEQSYNRVDQCPMGAAALATSSFPLNRKRVAELLGFNSILENSIDCVSSRDFILEVMAAIAITAVDLSRLAEDLILWGSLDFNFIELPDHFSSTSSIMPQKKNPEVLEVVRARAGHVLGDLVAAATILKGVPSGYNLDFQEITPKLWESLDETRESINVLSRLVVELKVNKDEISERCSQYFFTSTELANVLTRKYGVPFRIAHKIVGLTVKRLIENKLTLQDLTPEFLSEAAEEVYGVPLNVEMEDIRASINPLDFVGSHKVKGGPSPCETKEMLRVRERRTVLSRARIAERKVRVTEAFEKLQSTVRAYVTTIEKLKSKN